jgi:hypothetical protein
MILIEMFRSVFVSYFLVMDLSVGVICYTECCPFNMYLVLAHTV